MVNSCLSRSERLATRIGEGASYHITSWVVSYGQVGQEQEQEQEQKSKNPARGVQEGALYLPTCKYCNYYLLPTTDYIRAVTFFWYLSQ